MELKKSGNIQNPKRLITPIAISLIVHIIVISKAKVPNIKNSKINLQKSALKVTKISRTKLNKLKTSGVKNGSKKFSIKTEPTKKSMQINQNKIDQQHERKNFTLKDLENKKITKLNKLHNLNKQHLNKKDDNSIRVLSLKSPQKITSKSLKNLSISSADEKILSRTGFNLHFTPPEGVDKDQLNTAEKIYYAFQKRTFQTYVSSFVKSYNETSRSKPYIKNTLQKEKHILTGRVLFDKFGNIISIKIIRWSKDDNVQELFEKTLKEIRAIPNPPKSLLDDNQEFYIYYQLNINV